jgi:hypothetical protein
MRTAFWAAIGLTAAGVAARPAEAKADTRFGIGIVVGSDHGYGYREAYRYGYDRGAQDGSDHGFKDGRRGKSFSFWQHGEYRDGDHGYHGWMGPRTTEPATGGVTRPAIAALTQPWARPTETATIAIASGTRTGGTVATATTT